MKTTSNFCLHLFQTSCLFVAMLAPSPLDAGTVAYWRFEGNGTNAPTADALVTGFAQHTAVQTNGILAVDSSGNGNTLYAWDSDPAGNNGFWIEYENNVPAPLVPQTAASNNWAIGTAPFGNNYPAIATWSAVSHPTGMDIETITPKTWTIEASIYATSFAGTTHHTFVGRDGNHFAITNGPGYSPLYFQIFNSLTNNLVIAFIDVAGVNYFVQDSSGVVTNHWYNVAAVSDGITLFLYKDSVDGNGYQLVGTAAETSTNTALAVPTGAYATMSDGSTWAWSVGRGRYGTSANPGDDHTDRFYGYIDEVRISDTALPPSQFLFAPLKRPVVTSLVLNDTNIVISGTNGPASGAFYLLTTTNLALPRSNWMCISTNGFDGNGNFNFTNPIVTGRPQSYYLLQLP